MLNAVNLCAMIYQMQDDGLCEDRSASPSIPSPGQLGREFALIVGCSEISSPLG